MTLKNFWLRQMMLIVGVPFVIFFMVTRLSLIPLLRHLEEGSGYGGQHAVTALMFACVIGAACAGLVLMVLVLRAGSIANRLKKELKASGVANDSTLPAQA